MSCSPSSSDSGLTDAPPCIPRQVSNNSRTSSSPCPSSLVPETGSSNHTVIRRSNQSSVRANHWSVNSLMTFAGTVLDRLGIHGGSESRYKKQVASLLLQPDSQHMIYATLNRGASGYGLWSLSDRSLKPLADSIQSRKVHTLFHSSESSMNLQEEPDAQDTPPQTTQLSSWLNRCKRWLMSVWHHHIFSISLTIIITKASLIYGIFAGMQSGAAKLLGWSVIIARACGLATLFWTSVMILSMSKTITTFICVHVFPIQGLLHANSLHKISGINLAIHSIIHTIIHLANTFPKLLEYSHEQWNAIIRCAKPWFRKVSFFEFPGCPLKEDLTVGSVFGSTVVITGFLLLIFLVLFRVLSSRKLRDYSHKIFRVSHNVLIIAWLISLYFHGGSQFFGIGIPLVVPVCGIFVFLYILHKLMQHMFRKSAAVTEAVFVSEKVLSVTITFENARNFFIPDGMFVLLSCAQISFWDSHPFSVCNSEPGNFKLAIGVRGNWTKKFAALCKQGVPLKVAVAGPYASPAFSLSTRERSKEDALVIVASGVGVTPFLSSLKTVLDRDACVIHMFWVVRFASEILHAKHTLLEILQNKRIILTIHVTAKVDEDTDNDAFFFSHTLSAVTASNSIPLKVNLPDGKDPVLPVKFGRPDWEEELMKIESSGTRWIYACAIPDVCSFLSAAMDACAENTGKPFVLTTEEF